MTPAPRRKRHGAVLRTEEIWWHLLRAAHRQAHRAGLAQEDAEDCAAAFASQAIGKRDRVLRRDLPPDQAEAWLARCASNWCRNFARALRRCSTVSWEIVEKGPRPAARPDPCVASALRTEVRRSVSEAARTLTPERCRVFTRHCIDGNSILQVADDLSTSPGAVRVSLHRARHQVQERLIQRGINEKYLA